MISAPEHIFIIDDHPLIANGIIDVCKTLLWTSPPQIITSISSLLQIKPLPEGLYIVDLRLGEEDGRLAIQYIQKNQPESKIMAFSSYDDPDIIQSALHSGAHQYMIKNASFTEMKQALYALWNGEDFVHPSVWKSITQNRSPLHVAHPLDKPRLTPKEKEILTLLLAEKTTREIAASLYISEKTVETHRTNLFAKFGVKKIVGLIKLAVELGFR